MSQSGGGSAASGSGSGSGSVVSTSTFGGISLVISEVEQSSSAAAEPVAVAGNEWDVDLPLSGHSHIVPASAPRNCLVCGWQCDVCDYRTKSTILASLCGKGKAESMTTCVR